MPGRDDFWRRLSYADQRHRIATPAFHVGGWFDLFLGGTPDNYVMLSERAAADHARRGQRLLIGPWTHTDQTGTAGELHFGMFASAQAIQLEQLFAAAHRIRAGISSSNFPCYDRNPGNGASAATATADDFVAAGQTIFHDATRPSFITLPVIPRS